MSFADWIKGKAPAGSVAKVETVAVAKPQTQKPAFSESENSGIDPGQSATATLATTATHNPAELPADLIEAATRYCVEMHGDGPEAVAEMLDDLQHYPPASWPKLTNHFCALEAPPRLGFDPFPGRLSAHCCADCRHGTPTDHPAILTCGLGIPSGLPIRGRWSTDRHPCESYHANVLDGRQPQAGYVDPRTGTETRTDVGWGYDRLEGWKPDPGRYDPGLRGLLDKIVRKSDHLQNANAMPAGHLIDLPKAKRTAEWFFSECGIVADIKTVQSDVNYRSAKDGFLPAAYDLAVKHLEENQGILRDLEQKLSGRSPLVVPVHAAEGAGINQIPLAMALAIMRETGWQVNQEIVQVNKAGHTKSTGWHRLVNQAIFSGNVESGREYVIIDDFVGQGGTFANLKGHIDSMGGKTVGAVSLAGKDYSSRLQLSRETLTALRNKHGNLEQWWREQFGFGFDGLTESEGRYLLRAEDADTIRNRLAEAKSKSLL
jgi:hypothetical protein